MWNGACLLSSPLSSDGNRWSWVAFYYGSQGELRMSQNTKFRSKDGGLDKNCCCPLIFLLFYLVVSEKGTTFALAI